MRCEVVDFIDNNNKLPTNTASSNLAWFTAALLVISQARKSTTIQD